MTDGMAPRLVFHGAETPMQIAVILIAVGVAMSLAWRSARAERRNGLPRRANECLALRWAALIVTGILLLQPTWAWTITAAQQGRIILAVDVSDSMLGGDTTADARELLQWGLGVGWLNRETVEPQLAAANIPRDDALAARFANRSRVEVATLAITAPTAGLRATLSKLGTLEGQMFAGEIAITPLEEWTTPATTTIAGLQPTTTRLSAVLQTAFANPDRKPLGVVLLTDGRDATPADTLALAKNLGSSGIPVYPVLIGSTNRPRDVALLNVEAPAATYRGDRPQIVVTFSAHGYEETPLTITLTNEGNNAATQTQTVVATGAAQSVTLTVAPEDIGRHRYHVQIAPRPGEVRVDNNDRDVVLQVVDDRTQILLAEGEPRWEFRYLEAALARDEHVELQTVLFSQPFLHRLEAPYFAQTWPDKTADRGTTRFASRDLLILGELDTQQMPAAMWTDVEKFVSEHGGTLVLIAGRNQSRWIDAAPTLRKLLPVTQPVLSVPVTAGNEAAGLQGWRWQLTPDGERQTFLQFATDAETNRAIWSVLPGATWALAGEPKPGATVWAWGKSSSPGNDPKAPPVPLLVHQHYGLGQVVWLATDSTWRWRLRAGDQFHHRFWGQLARWAATTKLAAGNEFVQFGPLRSSYSAGETVTIQARWSAAFAQEHPNRQPRIELRRGDDVLNVVELTAEPQRPLVSSTELRELGPGDYRVRLVLEGDSPTTKPMDADFTITAPQGSETADVTADAPFLESIAEASGGRLFRLHELDELPKMFPAYVAVSSLPDERTLWDRWPLLVLLIGLLCGEWWCRRSAGLA